MLFTQALNPAFLLKQHISAASNQHSLMCLENSGTECSFLKFQHKNYTNNVQLMPTWARGTSGQTANANGPGPLSLGSEFEVFLGKRRQKPQVRESSHGS